MKDLDSRLRGNLGPNKHPAVSSPKFGNDRPLITNAQRRFVDEYGQVREVLAGRIRRPAKHAFIRFYLSNPVHPQPASKTAHLRRCAASPVIAA